MVKVTCNHCGAKNELGRMFCNSCGKRMQITNADVNEAVVEKKSFNPLSLVQPLLFVVFLAAVAAALVPAGRVGRAESDGLALRVKGKYQHLVRAATAREAATETFDADELNMFMKLRTSSGGTNAPALAFRMEGDRLIVVQDIRMTPSQAVNLRFTRRADCAGGGRILEPARAYFGHLPLPGPLKGIATRPMAQAFVLTPSEQTIEKHLAKINIRDGKLEITVGP